ncbi:MAG: glycosyltransferase [Tannerella sp.]|nr:glycosyltransferase [Tannerella sp.]
MREYLEACKIIKNKYKNVICLLVGPFDTNPSAIKEHDLKPYIEDNIIEYAGEQRDVKPYISKCSTYILPSYHEGTPRSVLQAMAMGRSIITTDAPGCRETVIDGENGFLVPVKDIDAIVDKMEHLINNPHINKQMGEKSRIIAEEKYDVRKINQVIFETMGLAYCLNNQVERKKII